MEKDKRGKWQELRGHSPISSGFLFSALGQWILVIEVVL